MPTAGYGCGLCVAQHVSSSYTTSPAPNTCAQLLHEEVPGPAKTRRKTMSVAGVFDSPQSTSSGFPSPVNATPRPPPAPHTA